jgi:UDP-GlcNAc:undecaprenyl-phosphate/decaprenyl-phosphate GlcNAc-1-phosphate transferase
MQYDYLICVFLIHIFLYFFFKKRLLKTVVKIKLVDRPGKNKFHKKPVPVTGGIIIFISLILYLFCNYFFPYFEKDLIDKKILILFFGTFFVFFIGLVDDILNIKAQKKIIIITIFNILLFQNINFFQTNMLIFDNFIISENVNIVSLSLFVSVFGFLAYHYSLAIMDGINGLFGTYVIILLLLLLIFFDLDYELKNLTLYIIFSLFFVTVLNFNGNLFLGNSGSLMMGTFVPYLLIYLYNIRESYFSIFTFISLVIIPILDMIRLFFIRILDRKSPFQKDMKHMHHLLIARFSLFISLTFYLTLCFLPFFLINQFKADPLLLVLIQVSSFFILAFTLNKK